MEGKSVIPMGEPFLDHWRIHTICDTLKTLRYLYSYLLGFLIIFLGCLFSFLGLLRESYGKNAANNHNRTDRNMYNNTYYILLI
jgi:hypothetical protein